MSLDSQTETTMSLPALHAGYPILDCDVLITATRRFSILVCPTLYNSSFFLLHKVCLNNSCNDVTRTHVYGTKAAFAQ